MRYVPAMFFLRPPPQNSPTHTARCLLDSPNPSAASLLTESSRNLTAMSLGEAGMCSNATGEHLD